MSSGELPLLFDELLDAIKTDNVDQLHEYLRKKEYVGTSFFEAKVNQREESLLHYACRHCKPDTVEYLLSNSICNPLSIDSDGNTPLHLLLKAILLIDLKEDFTKAYRNLVLGNLQDFAPSMNKENDEGETPKELLELADSVYKYHLETNKKAKIQKDDKMASVDQKEWETKLAEELQDEYSASWGKYEDDFTHDTKEHESYDTWADRMLHEHTKKNRPRQEIPPLKSEVTPSWTKEDQEEFVKKEKMHKEQAKKAKLEEKRVTFLSKLKLMGQNSGTIVESDLPFGYSEKTEAIGELILLHVKEMEHGEAKRKALRELQRLWHPDKFAQIFGQRLSESIRDHVLKKVTEISQFINMFTFRNNSKNVEKTS